MKGYLSRIFRFILHLIFPIPQHKQNLPQTYTQFVKAFSPQSQSQRGVTFFLHYKEPLVKDLIEEIKRYNNKHYFDFIGKTLSLYIEGLDLPSRTPIYLIPLPQTKIRLRERGYDVTQQMVQSILTHNNTNLLDGSGTLIHNRSQHQSGYSNRAERIDRSRGMFQISKNLPDKSLCILIDDVCTTGASMQEAERILQKDGCIVLQKITLAHS